LAVSSENTDAAAELRVEGYRIVRSLGRGSLGEVFEAVQLAGDGFEKRVALKRLAPEHAQHADRARAFLTGAEIASRLSHPGIVQVLDVSCDPPEGGLPWVVSEHVSGVSLSALLEQLGRSGTPRSPGVAVVIGAEVAKALDHAHRRADGEGRGLGILHGDLTPSNVFVTAEGEVKVADFCVGEALFRSEDADALPMAGKWAHATPERARGEALGSSSDLFAVGILMFELLTGENPFERPGIVQVKRALALLERAPSVAERAAYVPERLAAIIEATLAPSPADRPASAARLHEALMAYGYASGVRFGAPELAALIARFEPPPAPSAPSLRALFHSIPANATPELEVRHPALESGESVPPPRPAESSGHDATLLVLSAQGVIDQAVQALIVPMLRRYGARVLEVEEHELWAVFGLERVDGRDAESAARCALTLLRTLRQSPLGLSCGLGSARLRLTAEGEPEPAALEAVMVSARALAGRRGWVVADRRTARDLRRGFELEPLGSEARAWVVEEARAEPLGEFVGRKPLLRQMGELLQRAHARRMQVLGLVGAPGIGKTRFLHELVRRLRSEGKSVALALACCPPNGKDLPLSALDAMLRALCGMREGEPIASVATVERQLRSLGLSAHQGASVIARLGAQPAPAGELAPLAPIFTQIFASLSRDRLQLFAWDDAHELDPASQRVLESALAPLKGARVVLLFAARPEQGSEYLRLPGYAEISIGELDRREARRLVVQRLGVDRVPDRVFASFFERSGGHPQLLEELLHEALDSGALVVGHRYLESAKLDELPVPRTLRAMLADRVRRLPDAQRELLVAAAVIGAPVDLAVLAELAEISVSAVGDGLQALEQRDLIRREGLIASFPSGLLPEVVLAGIDPERLARLHRRAADALLRVFEQQAETVPRIAEHLYRAGATQAAAAYFARSGLSDLRAGRFDSAVRQLSRALLAGDPDAEPAEVGLRVAALEQAVARSQDRAYVVEAVDRVEAGLERARRLDSRTRTQVLLDLGKILARVDLEQRAHALFARVVGESEPWPELCRAAIVASAELALRRGDFAEALELIARAGNLGLGSLSEQHRLLLTQAQALASLQRFEEATEALAYAAALVPSEDAALACERDRTRAIVQAFRGDWAGCAEASELAAEHGRRAGLSREVAANLHNQAEALVRMGELARGYAVMHASLAVAEEDGHDRIANFDRMFLAFLDALDGLPGGEEMLSACITRAEQRGWALDHLTGRYLSGKLLAQRGELAAAGKELNAVRDLAVRMQNRPLARDCGYELELLEPTIAER
jgi:eukaryotic-like serine/threonine-protein kinase